MKKRLFIYFLCILLCFSFPVFAMEDTESSTNESEYNEAPYPADAPEITSTAAIVMDIDSGSVLYQKDAYSPYYPASITKVMTALVALEQGNLSDTITMSEAAIYGIEKDSSHIGLDVGEQLSLKDALYGMMLNSANEAAWAIAEHIAGSVDGFAELMNQKAESLGCVNTHFVNANGLHDDNHYTCAYDMALIGRAAYEIPEFREMAGCKTYTIPATNLRDARELWHSDGMLFSSNKYYYEYCTAGKTGYTTIAKGTLVSYAEKDGKRLICVVLNGVPSAETFYDTIKLFDFCFDNYVPVQPLADFSFDGENTADSSILSNYYYNLGHSMPELSVDTGYTFYFRTDINIEEIQKNFVYYENPDSNVVGKIEFIYDGNKIGETDIISKNYVPKSIQVSTDAANQQKKNLKYKRIFDVLIVIILLLLLVLLRILTLQKQRTKRNRKITRYYPKIKPEDQASTRKKSGGHYARRKK